MYTKLYGMKECLQLYIKFQIVYRFTDASVGIATSELATMYEKCNGSCFKIDKHFFFH